MLIPPVYLTQNENVKYLVCIIADSWNQKNNGINQSIENFWYKWSNLKLKYFIFCEKNI